MTSRWPGWAGRSPTGAPRTRTPGDGPSPPWSVTSPGRAVFEVDGTPLAELLALAGGPPAGRHWRAALSGVSNAVLPVADFDVPLDLRGHGRPRLGARRGRGGCSTTTATRHGDERRPIELSAVPLGPRRRVVWPVPHRARKGACRSPTELLTIEVAPADDITTSGRSRPRSPDEGLTEADRGARLGTGEGSVPQPGSHRARAAVVHRIRPRQCRFRGERCRPSHLEAPAPPGDPRWSATMRTSETGRRGRLRGRGRPRPRKRPDWSFADADPRTEGETRSARCPPGRSARRGLGGVGRVRSRRRPPGGTELQQHPYGDRGEEDGEEHVGGRLGQAHGHL